MVAQGDWVWYGLLIFSWPLIGIQKNMWAAILRKCSQCQCSETECDCHCDHPISKIVLKYVKKDIKPELPITTPRKFSVPRIELINPKTRYRSELGTIENTK